jgi:hypothetical protein
MGKTPSRSSENRKTYAVGLNCTMHQPNFTGFVRWRIQFNYTVNVWLTGTQRASAVPLIVCPVEPLVSWASPNQFDLTRAPLLGEERFEWPVEAQINRGS